MDQCRRAVHLGCGLTDVINTMWLFWGSQVLRVGVVVGEGVLEEAWPHFEVKSSVFVPPSQGCVFFLPVSLSQEWTTSPVSRLLWKRKLELSREFKCSGGTAFRNFSQVIDISRSQFWFMYYSLAVFQVFLLHSTVILCVFPPKTSSPFCSLTSGSWTFCWAPTLCLQGWPRPPLWEPLTQNVSYVFIFYLILDILYFWKLSWEMNQILQKNSCNSWIWTQHRGQTGVILRSWLHASCCYLIFNFFSFVTVLVSRFCVTPRTEH